MSPRRLLVLLPLSALLLIAGSAAAADDADDGASNDLTDIELTDIEGTFYEDAVAGLTDEGIILGCEPDLFCPDDAVTRAQAASLLVRAFDVEPADEQPFDDVDGTTHEDAINALAASGITRGCDEDAFCPDEPVSRGQAASLLDRALDLPPTEGPFFDDVGETHEPAVDRLANIGITAGCSASLVSFCPNDDIKRSEFAVLLGRYFGFADLVELDPYEERRAEQDEIDEQRAQEEAERRAQEEAEQAAEDDPFYVPEDRYAMFEQLAECESNGNWQANTGNGYYGGLQFLPSTWESVGGTGLPHQASKDEQIYRGDVLQRRSGWGQWPACTSMLGWR